MKTKRILFSLILIAVCFPTYSQGLGFMGMEKQIDERTSCNFFGRIPRRFSGELAISFQFSPQLVSCSGTILRITDPHDESFIWNMSFDGLNGDVAIRINEEGRSTLIYGNIPRKEMTEMTWTDISLSMSFERDSVTLIVGQRKWSASYNFEKESKRLSIDFGRSGHMTDVAPFGIRDLTISDSNRTLVFPLNEMRGKFIHDSRHIIRGVADNPIWMMTESLEWTQLIERQSKTNGGSIYDPITKRFYLYDTEGLWTYEAITKKTFFTRYTNPCPLTLEQGTCYISGNSLVAYETRMDHSTSPRVARLDLSSCTWTESWDAALPSSRFHHASFINPSNGKYIIFGGYGFTTYSGEFLEFNEETGSWDEIWEDSKNFIMPRYFTSAGVDPGNEYAYIFGGMGNECGEAIVGRMYIYDLYRMRLSDGHIEKMWEIKIPGLEVVPGRNIVVTDKHIFAACYPEYNTESEILLYRFSIDDGSWQTFGTKVPINSDKIGTNANLYVDRSIKKLFLITKVSPDQKETVLNVYSINFPPLRLENTITGSFVRNIITTIAAILGIAIIILSFLFVSKYRKRKRQAREYLLTKSNPGNKIFISKDTPNSIKIFGAFKITDRNGIDITSTFYNQSSLLLILLIKYGSHGLSARRMSTIFWPDKEEDKARNSRGFAISTLRNKLKDLDGVKVTFHDKHYFLEIEDPASCDLLLAQDGMTGNNDDDDRTLCVLSRGRFLSGIVDESLDNFKAEIDDTCLSYLENEISKRYSLGKWLETIEIAEMIFLYDPASEIAIIHLVGALKNIGRYDEAKERFSAFACEVRKTSGETCRFDYKTIPAPQKRNT